MDPREDKLPKWAQELLRCERMKNALRFPEEDKPEPDFIFNGSGHDELRTVPPGYRGWCFTASTTGGLRRYWMRHSNLYASDILESYGHRPAGAVFLEEDAARLALRWMIAEKAAADLLDAQTVKARA